MKTISVVAASAAGVLLGAGGAFAQGAYPYQGAYGAAPARAAPIIAAPPTCTSIVDFFATACQLAWFGVRFYGTIDVGYGYQTNGSPFDRIAGPGVNYFPGKNSLGGKWLPSPNALSQSNIGFLVKEPLGGGWSFVGQLETAFDPLSMRLANSSGSVHENNGLPLVLQTTNGDGSSQGRFYNSLGFAGVSHDAWGALTVGRQNTLMRDSILAYDPMASAYAFSVIGFFGASGGGGLTEQGKATTAVKYRINFGNYHFGAFGQFGGYSDGNSSQGQVLGDIGADWNIGPGVFSADVVGGFTKDGVVLGLSGPSLFPGIPNPIAAQTLSATISDNSNIMVSAKYSLDRWKFYAGWTWMQFTNPSDNITSFTDLPGYLLPFPGGTINLTQYATGDKILQVVWTGARYSITDSVDLVGAYYHQDQNDFSGGTSVTAGGVTQTCAQNRTSSGKCAGTMDAASFLIDWKFAPKWDTYVGTLYSKMNGGLASGFLADNNWATTAGIRFRW
jgi:predicted porin